MIKQENSEVEVGEVVIWFEGNSLLVIGDSLIFIDNFGKLTKKIENSGVSRSQAGGFLERIDNEGVVFGIGNRKIVINLGFFFPKINIGGRNTKSQIGIGHSFIGKSTVGGGGGQREAVKWLVRAVINSCFCLNIGRIKI